ncbi:MAG: hypothetical protein U9N87_05935 [Planctomycetota bacterium]|nr:hypothetical protein [Planctomycetota bacterium]
MKRLAFNAAALCMLLCLSTEAADGPQGPFRLESDEFPIGMYSVDSAGAMTQAESLGIDYVQSYQTGKDATEESIRSDLKYLDLAHKHGRRVLFQFRGKNFVDRKDGVEAMLRVMNAVKDHPALGFWVFYDEPDGKHSPEQLKPFYRAAKKAFPKIPFAICHCWSAHYADYKHVADINLNDLYPVQHKPFPQCKLDNMRKFTDRMLAMGCPVMPINQAFNWQSIARRTKRKQYRGSPVDEMRYPNPKELRYLCYGPLAQGARGMFWWSYYWSVRTGYTWLSKEFAPVNLEFRRFTRLVAPAHKGETFKSARDSDMLMAMWRRPGGDCLVAVNDRPITRDLTCGTEGKIPDAKLIPWGSTRAAEAAIRKGTLTVKSAEPWEVFVWRLEGRSKR